MPGETRMFTAPGLASFLFGCTAELVATQPVRVAVTGPPFDVDLPATHERRFRVDAREVEEIHVRAQTVGRNSRASRWRRGRAESRAGTMGTAAAGGNGGSGTG